MWGFLKTDKLRKLYARHTGRDDMPDAVRKQLEVEEAYRSETLISNATFVIFDTETTGLHLEGGDRLLSLAAVKMTGGRIYLGDAFNELIDPKRPIPTSSIFIHGITPDVASARPHVSGVFLKFLAYIGCDVLVSRFRNSAHPYGNI